jgi:hypothetical protein
MSGVLNALGQVAVRGLDLPTRMLRPEALMGREGAAALAPYDGEAPLRVLTEAYRRTADLNLIGCFAARFDVTRLIRNLTGLRQREMASPETLATPVERPIFITGLPRSGTTFLHKLLAEDPGNRYPAVWETVYPLPRRPGDTAGQRIAAVERQLATFERMAPAFRAVHPLDATSPQECTEITAHVFRSFRFETTHHIPAYRDWLRAADHVPAYRFHRAFLQHLQQMDGAPRRWVLKCPDHVFTLDALDTVYPDACVVFLHRDPLDVLASVAGLTAILRHPFSPRVDRQAIGRQVLEDWLAGATAMIEADAERRFPEHRVAHIRFRDFTAAPLATIEALYERFGIPMSDAARERMRRRIAELPRGGYGGVTHDLADYGIDTASERPRFAPYAERFGV